MKNLVITLVALAFGSLLVFVLKQKPVAEPQPETVTHHKHLVTQELLSQVYNNKELVDSICINVENRRCEFDPSLVFVQQVVDSQRNQIKTSPISLYLTSSNFESLMLGLAKSGRSSALRPVVNKLNALTDKIKKNTDGVISSEIVCANTLCAASFETKNKESWELLETTLLSNPRLTGNVFFTHETQKPGLTRMIFFPKNHLKVLP